VLAVTGPFPVQRVRVEANAVASLDLRLPPAKIVIYVRGSPASEEVRLRGGPEGFLGSVEALWQRYVGSGPYVIEGLFPGRYEITMRHEDVVQTIAALASEEPEDVAVTLD
jgi:hypothetical protein